jgi:chaperonin GroES
MNIKPLADRVLVKNQLRRTKNCKWNYYPDSAKEKPPERRSIAVGNGTKDEEMVCAVGNTVLYG